MTITDGFKFKGHVFRNAKNEEAFCVIRVPFGSFVKGISKLKNYGNTLLLTCASFLQIY